MRRINEQGTTIIFIDHDMDFVAQIARRTTVLHYGKIFAEGTFEEVHNNQDVVQPSTWARYKSAVTKDGVSMLRIEQLTSGYGEISIIRDISFEIRKGEIVSVIGRNGVGKSTLMKTLIGLIRNKSGKIYFEEKDITAAKAHERAQMGIGYVPQGHGVFPLLSVEENLRMGSMINRAELDKSLGHRL